jgi:hypothetical protein
VWSQPRPGLVASLGRLFAELDQDFRVALDAQLHYAPRVAATDIRITLYEQTRFSVVRGKGLTLMSMMLYIMDVKHALHGGYKMDTNGKRYLREFLPAMAGYTALVPVSIWLLRGHEHSPWRFLFAVLPVFPAALAMGAGIRFFRGLDEMQRRIQFEGLAFSFLATGLITLTYGFLENAGLPRLNWIWIVPILTLSWSIGLTIASRRYGVNSLCG